MDTVEATKMVMSRIQKLDPENASKIMGYILIQDQGDNEMIRLAFGPENLLLSVIKQAKSFLDISSNTSSAPSSTTPSLFIHRNSPQIVIPNNGFHHMNPPSPSSPWSLSGSFPDHHLHRGSPRPVSYAAVVNGGGSSASSFYNNFNDPTDEYSTNNGLQVVSDQLSFFDESKNVDFIDPMVSPGGRSDSVLFPYPNDTSNWPMVSGNCGDAHHHHLHRRSCSVNDVFLGGGGGGNDDMGGGGGFGGWRPCMYFARGFCKNGTSCKFVHGGFGDEIGLNPSSPTAVAGSPTGKIDSFDDLLRIKAIQQQQQRIAAMAGGGVPPFPFNRCMNFLNENPRSAAALMMGDEFHKFSRCRPDRNDFAAMGLGNSNSSSRQIYLTFPADSTFKEEDVSNYFSMFGPVQDVRIPYQQKRMFGFVTFMLPETVKAILAKGNPHFVCDSRVLVKPYKEKGKIPDKKHQQQMERGDFSGCLSPTALESAEPFDHIPFGARMFNQEMILRRKLEERAELQQAMEFQDRRLMNLQLSDLKNHHFHPNLSVSSPTQSCAQINQNLLFSSDGNNEELVSGAKISTHDSMNSLSDESDPNVPPEVKVNDGNSGSNGTGKEEISDQNETDKHESLEHILPDNLFASPKKSAAIDNQTIFSTDMPETDDSAATASSLSAANDIQVLPTTSTPLEMLASLNSCYFQMPRKMEE
ncbi:zinc finger CCCH domain-containing protein 23-like isoform X2 [Cynara cardunculus var. scolymus]|uniref:zinc finger CCCH domain-containing protein 23-like isoform X2 n=1 Tax=Cynara cardunculus var. scolymus TaxID=59895 RepID=UPI000D6306F0|nr:zinc finger CCCH domain-containing protein 23-like isoform X2 [Cynara cardunculus var. scolymus]